MLRAAERGRRFTAASDFACTIADIASVATSQVRTAAPFVNQVRTYAGEAKASPTEVSSILEQRIRGVAEEAGLAETGRVLSIG